MTTYYVGPGGDNGNNGTTWALRKLTLNGAEDIPVAANDTVYVGPGVYRETLTCDVSGSSGQPITYIGDVTGVNTDGVGGIVRVTGSDDDQTGTRAYCISASDKAYRHFRGFSFDMATSDCLITGVQSNNFLIEDCYFGEQPDDADRGIYLTCAASDLITIRRCVFISPASGIFLTSASEVALDSGSVIENCFMYGSSIRGISVGIYFSGAPTGVTVKNCTIVGRDYGIRTATATTGTININNCILARCYYALYAVATGDLVEDYNAVAGSNNTPRTAVSTGSNSNTYPDLLEIPIMRSGLHFPWHMFAPSKWSALRRIAGSGESTTDLYGQTRPTTSAKKSWGAVQYQPGVRETTTTRGSSAASIKLADAGRHQIFVPVAAASTTIAVYAYREANYAGTAPQMIIKEAGQSDRTTTDAASASQWNELTDTFTPSGDVDYVVVELVSNNTATSGSYATYFDDLSVS